MDQIKDVEDKMGESLKKIGNISETGHPDISQDGAPPTIHLAKFNDSFDEKDFERRLVIDAPSIGIDFKGGTFFRDFVVPQQDVFHGFLARFSALDQFYCNK